MLHPKYILDASYTHPKNPVFDPLNDDNPYDLADDQKAIDIVTLASGPFPYRFLKTGEGTRTDYMGLFAADSTYNDNEYDPEYSNPDNQIARSKALFHCYGPSEEIVGVVREINSQKVMAETRLALRKILQVDSEKEKEGYKVALFDQLMKDLRIVEAQTGFANYNPLLVTASTHFGIAKLFKEELGEVVMANTLDFTDFKKVIIPRLHNLSAEVTEGQKIQVMADLNLITNMLCAGVTTVEEIGLTETKMNEIWDIHANA